MTTSDSPKFFAIPVFLFLFGSKTLIGSTVLEVDVDYLLDEARLISEGEVVSSVA
jgi:hypothetical protein